jgi:hypothetical protein
MLVQLAEKHGVGLRQGYPRVGKRALINFARLLAWLRELLCALLRLCLLAASGCREPVAA